LLDIEEDGSGNEAASAELNAAEGTDTEFRDAEND
jgi:hypothetical protein